MKDAGVKDAADVQLLLIHFTKQVSLNTSRKIAHFCHCRIMAIVILLHSLFRSLPENQNVPMTHIYITILSVTVSFMLFLLHCRRKEVQALKAVQHTVLFGYKGVVYKQAQHKYAGEPAAEKRYHPATLENQSCLKLYLYPNPSAGIVGIKFVDSTQEKYLPDINISRQAVVNRIVEVDDADYSSGTALQERDVLVEAYRSNESPVMCQSTFH